MSSWRIWQLHRGDMKCVGLFHFLPMNQTNLSPLVQQLITDHRIIESYRLEKTTHLHWPSQARLSVGHGQCRQHAWWMLWNTDSEKNPCTKMLTSCVRVSNVLGCGSASETFTGWPQHKQFQCQLITLEDTMVVVVSKHKIDGDMEWCLRTWWL